MDWSNAVRVEGGVTSQSYWDIHFPVTPYFTPFFIFHLFFHWAHSSFLSKHLKQWGVGVPSSAVTLSNRSD